MLMIAVSPFLLALLVGPSSCWIGPGTYRVRLTVYASNGKKLLDNYVVRMKLPIDDGYTVHLGRHEIVAHPSADGSTTLSVPCTVRGQTSTFMRSGRARIPEGILEIETPEKSTYSYHLVNILGGNRKYRAFNCRGYDNISISILLKH